MNKDRILSGRALAREIKQQLKQRIEESGLVPGLAIIHVSPDANAGTYVRLKHRFGSDIGALVRVLQPMPSALMSTITRLNEDGSIHGIIVQLPLPAGIDTAVVLESIVAPKDVDGLRAESPYVTAGPRGIIDLLTRYVVPLEHQLVSVVGRGRTMGGPLVPLLSRAGVRVEAFDLERPIDASILRRSAIIIGATGVPGIIKSDNVSAGTVVIDATGVDLDSALLERADIRLSPPTGGVGPMTVAALFENLVDAALA